MKQDFMKELKDSSVQVHLNCDIVSKYGAVFGEMWQVQPYLHSRRAETAQEDSRYRGVLPL